MPDDVAAANTAAPVKASIILSRLLRGLPVEPAQLATLHPAWAPIVEAAQHASPDAREEAQIVCLTGEATLDRILAALKADNHTPPPPQPPPAPPPPPPARAAAHDPAASRPPTPATDQPPLPPEPAPPSAPDTEAPARVAQADHRAPALAALELPVVPRLIVDDCSPERLAMLMHEQGGR